MVRNARIPGSSFFEAKRGGWRIGSEKEGLIAHPRASFSEKRP
jgi:hypothetical protein